MVPIDSKTKDEKQYAQKTSKYQHIVAESHKIEVKSQLRSEISLNDVYRLFFYEVFYVTPIWCQQLEQ